MSEYGYSVHLDGGDEKRHYDDVVVTEGGWLSCYLDLAGSHRRRNVKFPPHRVHEVEMEVRNE